MGLVIGNGNGKDFNFPSDKVIASRKFANKVWNIARFLIIMFESFKKEVPFYSDKINSKIKIEDRKILKKLDQTVKKIDNSLEKYRFADAAEEIYQFIWHELADIYLEQIKNREDKNIALAVLRHVFINSLRLLHPFMPFVTEAIWGELKNIRKYSDELLINSSWPN